MPDRGSFYTSSSGIWQTVWLEPVPQANITRLDQTPNLTDSTLRLIARTSGDTEGLTVEATALDGDRVVGRVTGAPDTELAIPVPGTKLWSPDSPFLYNLRVRLLRGLRPVDSVGSYFGMRQIGTAPGADGKLRMTLNGRTLFHMSTLDQGFWSDGIHTAPTDAALRFDLEQHKALGFNTVRKHIKVEPDRWFYHADRLGLLVWQDMPAMRTSSQLPRSMPATSSSASCMPWWTSTRASPRWWSGCRSTKVGASGTARRPGGSPMMSRRPTRAGWSTRTVG